MIFIRLNIENIQINLIIGNNLTLFLCYFKYFVYFCSRVIWNGEKWCETKRL